jgi:ribosomal protein L12E/L44/L45/RPP1/RPP2
MDKYNEDLSWMNAEGDVTEPMIDTFAVETLLKNRTTETASKRLSGILGDLGVSITAEDLKLKLQALSDEDVSELVETLNTAPTMVFKASLLRKLNLEDTAAV